MNQRSGYYKTVRLPQTHSVGTLYNFGAWSGISLELLAAPADELEARGDIRVPEDALLKLQVSSGASKDLSFLRELQADDLTWLDLSETRVSDQQLQHLEKLAGLSGLRLNGTRISDDGLKYLLALSEINDLELQETPVGDNGPLIIGRLSSLCSLDLSSTLITDNALTNLASLTAGRNLEPEDVGQVYFQDVESYREGVRYGSDREDEWAKFETGSENELGHIFHYESALEVLMRCSLRRRGAGFK